MGRTAGRLIAAAVVLAAGAFAAAYVIDPGMFRGRTTEPTTRPTNSGSAEHSPAPMRIVKAPHISVWWGSIPAGVGTPTTTDPHATNTNPTDYVGADTCRDCHPKNHTAWSMHPHRFMNAVAGPDTVRGDFSGVRIPYMGGEAVFEKSGDTYLMKLRRGDVRRTYKISQTIGSRFFQYYVGTQTEGPEPADHPFVTKEHVLPLGYWIDQKEWVPTVHIGPEQPDGQRPDPFAPPANGRHFAEYAVSCNYCHTTFPLGDMLARRPHQMGEHARVTMDWSVREYLRDARPQELPAMDRMMQSPAQGPRTSPMADWDARKYAANLGVSCEACHLGAREHVASKGAVRPRFFPASPHLVVEASKVPDPGRTVDNENWACGRCHTGTRPTFAAGMSVWNSVEYSDAARGSCYSRLKCTDCHNPHEATGRTWSKPPAHDDAVCIECHKQYKEPAPRQAHTHHPAGSEGDRCLNCHMPRINEGLQDVVRTHMIYSPTRADMIEANHPNACNLCHTDRPIDWTLGHLKDWYKKTYDDSKIDANYPHRKEPVGEGWMASDNESVRLVAADAMAKARDPKVIPRLLDAMDDPFLMNRQFAAKSLQEVFGIRPAEFGYHFYQTPDERREALAKLRKKFAPGVPPIAAPLPRPNRPVQPGSDPR